MRNKNLRRVLAALLSSSLLLGQSSLAFAESELLLQENVETEGTAVSGAGDTTVMESVAEVPTVEDPGIGASVVADAQLLIEDDSTDDEVIDWSQDEENTSAAVEALEAVTESASEYTVETETELSFAVEPSTEALIDDSEESEAAVVTETVSLDVEDNFSDLVDTKDTSSASGNQPAQAGETVSTSFRRDYYGAQLNGTAARKIYDKRVEAYVKDSAIGNVKFTFSGDKEYPFYADFTTAIRTKTTADGKVIADTSTLNRNSAVYQQLKLDLTIAMQASEDAFTYDHPEVYWYRPGVFTYSMSFEVNSAGKVFCRIDYIHNQPNTIFDGAQKLNASYQAAVAAVTAQVRAVANYTGDGSPSAMAQIQAAHDWLCTRFYYDHDAYNNRAYLSDSRIFSSVSAFVDGVGTGAVCEGYAKAFKVLMDQLNIPCVLISGTANSNNIPHMWNAVSINGKWYMMDVTWDDRGGLDDASYTYYLCCGDEPNHHPDGNFNNSKTTLTFAYPQLERTASHTHGSFAHAFTRETREPTAETNGYTRYLCADDQIYYYKQVVSAGEASSDGAIDLSKAVTYGLPTTIYSGSSQTPLPMLVINGVLQTLSADNSDYSVQWINNLNTGIATVKVIANSVSRFTGELISNWTISRAFITNSTVKLANMPSVSAYTGNAQKPEPVITYGSTVLVKDRDYTLSWSKNQVPGTATLTITGKGNYINQITKTWKIQKRQLSASDFRNLSTTTYTGSAQYPVPSVSTGLNLKQNVDYTLSWNNNLNAGTATVVITGIGNCYGTVQKTWQIQRRQLSASSFRDLPATTYSGSAQYPAVSVSTGYNLKRNVDYTLSWNNNLNAGTAAMVITGIGNYYGTVTKTWQIKPLPLSSMAISIPDVVFNNRAQTPAISMSCNGRNMPATVNASWADNKTSGTASVTLTGYGNLTGTRTVNFRVIPMTPTVTSVKSRTKKKVTVKWKKVAGATKYQVQYSLYSDFRSAKTKNVSSKSKSKVLSGLKRKKTYYVRVRCYKTVKGVKYYSNWSSIRSVKVK